MKKKAWGGKKRSFKRSKKTSKRRRMNWSNKDTFSVQLRSTGTIVPTQGIVAANYFYTTIPLMGTTIDIGVTQNAEFKLYKNMYDQVRINSVHIKVTPKANVLSQSEATNDAALNLKGDGIVHTVIDRDNLPSTQVSRLIRYPSYKAYSVMKTFTRDYAITWGRDEWLDTEDLYADMNYLRRMGALGGIYLYAENLLENGGELLNEPWGQIEVTYGVVFRGKVQSSLAVNEAGDVTVGKPGTTETPPTPLINLMGTINDSRIVDVVDGGEKGVEGGGDPAEES